MDFIQLAQKRYSTRLYHRREVEKEKIYSILEAARVAPSAANKQPCIFYVLSNTVDLLKVKSCYHREWISDVPVVIIACVDHNKCWRRSDGKESADIDVAIAVDHMTLEAANQGLGTCWICNFDKKQLEEVLKLPVNIEPVVILPIGYAADECKNNRHTSSRKKLEEIIRWEI